MTQPLAPLSHDLALQWSLPADQHPVLTYLARLAPGSRRTMRQALDAIARLVTRGSCDAMAFGWPALRYQHTAGVRSRLAELHAPATANRMLAALRGTLKEAWRLGLMTAEDYHRAVDLEPVRGSSLPRGRALSLGEIRALVEACRDGSAIAARDLGLLAVLYSTGLRRAEAVALELADFEVESGALTVRRGKGRRERVVYVRNGAAAALESWLAVRGAEPGPLFYRGRRGDRLVPESLTPQAVLDILARCAARAGVARCSPHDLRRSFVSGLLEAGADLSVVSALAGHADVQTTRRYDRRGERAKQAAAAMLSFPYVPRES